MVEWFKGIFCFKIAPEFDSQNIPGNSQFHGTDLKLKIPYGKWHSIHYLNIGKRVRDGGIMYVTEN